MSASDSFPAEVVRKLRWYVYRLVDPRTGQTFYVGKGQGNRVFAHSREEKGLRGDPEDNKLVKIREIRRAGLEVGHVIHRHGMDEKTALAVESALIDAYPGLDNRMSGVGASAYGAMHAQEIIRQYGAKPARFRHRALLINVNRSVSERSLLEATRYAWRLKVSQAEKAEVILATERGLIVGAFVADQWHTATTENFPGLAEDAPDRIGFEGHEAPAKLRRLYVGKRVPDQYRKRGAANPVRYAGPW